MTEVPPVEEDVGVVPTWAAVWTENVNAELRDLNIRMACAYNSSATLNNHELLPVMNAAGDLPPWTPATRGVLYDASDNNITLMLNFYGLPLQPPGQGSMRSRRIESIAQAYGVRSL